MREILNFSDVLSLKIKAQAKKQKQKILESRLVKCSFKETRKK